MKNFLFFTIILSTALSLNCMDTSGDLIPTPTAGYGCPDDESSTEDALPAEDDIKVSTYRIYGKTAIKTSTHRVVISQPSQPSQQSLAPGIKPEPPTSREKLIKALKQRISNTKNKTRTREQLIKAIKQKIESKSN